MIAANEAASLESVSLSPGTAAYKQTEHFLTLLDEGADVFTFQTFDDNKQRKDPSLTRVLHGTPAECRQELCRLNDAGAGIYVNVNATDGIGRKKYNMTRIRAIWQEQDRPGCPILPVTPHITVESSPGKHHRYILLEDCPLEAFDGLQERLVADYGSDPNAKDIARVLRLPGFFHMKDPAHPHLVRIVEQSNEQPLPYIEAVSIFPPVVRKQKALPEPGQPAANEEEIRSALGALIPDSPYGEWLAVGMALHDHTGGSAAGLEMWDSWSSKGKLYRPGECSYKWGSFGARSGTTIKTLFKMANDTGWRWDKGDQGAKEFTGSVMTSEECRVQANLSIEIPDDIAYPGGLISLGMDALSQPGMSAIRQYNLPIVLTTIANAIGSRLVCRGVYANLFNIKVGPTSTGKSEGDKRLVQAIREIGLTDFYGPTDFASGPALFRALEDRPRCMIVIDECTSMFRRSGKTDMVADGKRDALLEIFSASGGIVEKFYADRRNNVRIKSPCLSLTGNATQEIFRAIDDTDFNTGLLQRFDFWCYDGPAPRRTRPSAENKKLSQFAVGIASIHTFSLNGGGDFAGVLPEAHIDIDVDGPGGDRLQAWSDEVVDRVNAIDDDGLRGIISRAYDLAIKYALVHAAGTRDIKDLTRPLTLTDINYGISVAWMLAEWKLTRLRDRVRSGDFDRDCELLKESIRRSVAIGRRSTLSVMANRCRGLKNFTKTYTDQILATLEARQEIVRDETKSPIAYQLVRI